MASQYNLQLKATLDTSQVQQELQRLRQMQNGASGGGGGAGRGTAAQNVAGLDVGRLTTSINRLDQTVQRLTQQLRRPAQQTGRTPSSSPAMPVAPGQFKPGDVSKQDLYKAWLGSRDYKDLVKTFNSAAREVLSREEIGALRRRFGGGRDWVHNAIRSGGLGPGFDEATYNRSLNRWYKDQHFAEQAKQQRAEARFARGTGTLIGGYLLSDIGGMVGGTVGQYMQAVGGGVQAGGAAAMTATMMGLGGAAGPIGIGVGLASVFAGLKSSAEQASAAILKMAEHFEDAYKTAHQATLKNQEAVQEARHQANADMLGRAGMTGEARKLAKYWSERAEAIQAQIGDSDPLSEEQKIKERAAARKAAVDRALKSGDVSWLDNDLAAFLFHMTGNKDVADQRREAYNKIDADALEQIAESQRKFGELQGDQQLAERIAAKYQAVVDKADANAQRAKAKSDAEVAARLQLAERTDQSIAGYRAQGAANATQALADQTLNDKALSPLQKFGKIAEELDRARAAKNGALTGAFEIARYLKENEGKLDSEEIARKMKKQADYERDAGFAQQRVGILENALSQIQHAGLAPDISHVTSLAQYGFNMGEKDDVAERMDKYYTRSLNLQEQIRNKLQEGVTTEATYTE